MPVSADKTTVTVVVPTELKEKLKEVAKIRRWTLSQAVGALIEENFDKWIQELGIEPISIKKQKSGRKKADKPKSP